MKNIKRLSFVMALVMIISSFAIALPITASAEVPVTDGVAVINETGVEYATLEDAIAAVANGQTITILKDFSIASGSGVVINRGINFTVDGNGHTVTNTVTSSSATGTFYAQSGTTTIKDLTIKTVSSSSSCYGAIVSRYSGTKVILKDCRIDVSGTTGRSAALVNQSAELSFEGKNIIRSTLPAFAVLNDSTVNTVNGGKAIVVASAATMSNSSAVSDSGVTVITSNSALSVVATLGSTAYTTIDEAVAAAASAGGVIELLQNTSVASASGLEVPTSAKSFTINGNSFKLSSSISTANRGTIYVQSGTVTINDLTFDTITSIASAWGAVLVRYENSKAVLNNCEVHVRGTAGVSAFGINTSGSLVLNNTNAVTTFGKLIHDHSSNANITATNSTGAAPSLGVSSISGLTFTQRYEAAIGSTKYATLVAAFAAAKDGDKITLLNDINIITEGTVGRIRCYAGGVNITLDGNGKKITSVSDVALAIHHDATLDVDNGGSLKVTVKDLCVESNAPTGSGVAVQVNKSTAVTLDNCIVHTKGSNLYGSVVVQTTGKLVAMGGTEITADTGIAIRLNEAAASATIHDARILADYAVHPANKNTTFNVMGGAELIGRVATISGEVGMTLNVTGGIIKTEATDTAVIVAPNENFAINLFGGSFEGGNAIYSNIADSGKNIAYPSSEKKATFLPTMTEGASIRLATEASGLRFETTIPKSLLEHANAIKDEGTTVSYGTIITPKEYLKFTDGIFTIEALDGSTINGAKYQQIIATNGITDEDDGSVSFRASLINIRLDNYFVRFAARGYISYTVNGTTGYVYADYNDADNSRSVTEVACSALADVKAESEGTYTTPVTSYLSADENGTYTLVTGSAFSRFSTTQLELLNNYYNGELNYTPKVYNEVTLSVPSNLSTTFRQLGRGYVRNNGIACDFTCTGIEFNAFCMGSIYMKTRSGGDTYWTIYVDGVRQKNRIYTNTSTTGWVEIAYGLAEGDHTITIVKQSQFTLGISTGCKHRA